MSIPDYVPIDKVTFGDVFRILISAPSAHGKSYFIKQFLTNHEQLCKVKFGEIVYCYNESDLTEKRVEFTNELSEMFPGVFRSQKGMPNLQELYASNHNRLIIFDDLARVALEDPSFCDLYEIWSNHKAISVIFTSQNLYGKTKFGVDIFRNSTHIVCIESRSDVLLIDQLSRRMFRDVTYLHRCFDHMREWPEIFRTFYIVLDNSYEKNSPMPPGFRVFTNIFPIGDFKDDIIRPIFFFKN